MENETLETVAEEFEDITVESHDGLLYFGDGRVVSEDNPLPVTIIETTGTDDDIEEESTVEVHYFEEVTESEKIELESVQRYSYNSRSSSVADFKNLWKLSIGGTDYDVLFPANASLEVVNGKLYNTGNSTVTGTVIDSSFSDSTYSDYTLSVLPVTSNSTQTTIYRYGSRCYLTHYSTGQNNNLVTNVSYVQVGVDHRPYGWDLAPRDYVICGLLLFSILVTILGGIFRR